MGKLFIIIGAIILCILFYFASKKAIEGSGKNIYVYPETGNQYRERKEFFDKFVKLKDWRNGIKGK